MKKTLVNLKKVNKKIKKLNFFLICSIINIDRMTITQNNSRNNLRVAWLRFPNLKLWLTLGFHLINARLIGVQNALEVHKKNFLEAVKVINWKNQRMKNTMACRRDHSPTYLIKPDLYDLKIPGLAMGKGPGRKESVSWSNWILTQLGGALHAPAQYTI